jgi:hypothetical protein
MRYLKRYNEGFLDYFKKNTPDDKITLDIINRLEKVKDINPYSIQEIEDTAKELPSWMLRFVGEPTQDHRNNEETEYFSKIYVVKFDDVDIVITNDRHSLIHTQTGAPAGYEKCKNPWKFYLGSDISDLAERIRSKESYREKLFHLVDKIYTEDIQRKRINRIRSEINPGADLLESNSGSGNASFNWLTKQNNEIYFELAEILQSKLFDDLDIVTTTDESFDDYDSPFYPHHKFWSFNSVGLTPVKTSDIGDNAIYGIYVYNISAGEKDEFYNSLIGLKDMVRDYLDKELVVSEDSLESGESDYIIKLV